MEKMKEMELVNWAISYICLKGHYAWRNNSGRIPLEYNGKKRFIKIGEKGLPDVLGYTKNGLFIGIECKIRPNKPTPMQLFQIENMKRSGCIAEVIYSPEELKKIL